MKILKKNIKFQKIFPDAAAVPMIQITTAAISLFKSSSLRPSSSLTSDFLLLGGLLVVFSIVFSAPLTKCVHRSLNQHHESQTKVSDLQIYF